jgi:hypothetical protein
MATDSVLWRRVNRLEQKVAILEVATKTAIDGVLAHRVTLSQVAIAVSAIIAHLEPEKKWDMAALRMELEKVIKKCSPNSPPKTPNGGDKPSTPDS